MLPFTLIYFRLAIIINLIIAINVSRLLCRALQTYSKFTIIHFMTELYQKDLLGSVHFCLNIVYANLRVQNKTLSKIN